MSARRLNLVALSVAAGLSVVLHDGKRIGYLAQQGGQVAGRVVIDGLHVMLVGTTVEAALDGADTRYENARRNLLSINLASTGPTAFEANKLGVRLTREHLLDIEVFGKLHPTVTERAALARTGIAA